MSPVSRSFATNLLTTRLADLTDSGLIRKVDAGGHREYELTDLGQQTDRLLFELASFGIPSQLRKSDRRRRGSAGGAGGRRSEATVRDDVERILSSSAVPTRVSVSGHVYKGFVFTVQSRRLRTFGSTVGSDDRICWNSHP